MNINEKLWIDEAQAQAECGTGEAIVWRSENADHPYHGGHRVVREGRGGRPPRFNLQRRERGRRQWTHVNGFHSLPGAVGYAGGQL